MTEKVILIENLDPVIFFGSGNIHFDKICQLFPQAKIVARGNEIKIFAEDEQMTAVFEKINYMVEYCKRYKNFPDEIFDYAYSGSSAVSDTAATDTNQNDDVITYNNNGKPIRAYTPNQKRLLELSYENDLIFVTGPAGSGKTYTAIALAVKSLKNREVKRIILSRPAVEAGENLGYLPGDMKEKLDPYLQPLYDALRDMIPAKKLKEYIEENIIEIAPLAFMRGRTLDNAFVILDEAQNATYKQIKMFLTRMGRNARFIITGDLTQVDLPTAKDSGLLSSIEILKDIEGIVAIPFDERDIVRHKLVKHIVKAYEENKQK